MLIKLNTLLIDYTLCFIFVCDSKNIVAPPRVYYYCVSRVFHVWKKNWWASSRHKSNHIPMPTGRQRSNFNSWDKDSHTYTIWIYYAYMTLMMQHTTNWPTNRPNHFFRKLNFAPYICTSQPNAPPLMKGGLFYTQKHPPEVQNSTMYSVAQQQNRWHEEPAVGYNYL